MRFALLIFLSFQLLFAFSQSDSISHPLIISDSSITEIIDTGSGEAYNMYELEEPVLFQGKAVEEAFPAYMAANLVYPKSAVVNDAQGTVILAFVVNSDSSVSDIQIISQPLGFGLDSAAIALIESTSGMWTPGMINGERVKTKFLMPIQYTLYGKSKKSKKKRK